MTDDALPALTGPVEIVGAGLIGTSVALVCSRLGIEVVLRDTSAENVRTAHGLGAFVGWAAFAVGAEIVRLLHDLNRREGLTIIMVTHNLEIAGETDRVVRLVEGRIDGAFPQVNDYSSSPA